VAHHCCAVVICWGPGGPRVSQPFIVRHGGGIVVGHRRRRGIGRWCACVGVALWSRRRALILHQCTTPSSRHCTTLGPGGPRASSQCVARHGGSVVVLRRRTGGNVCGARAPIRRRTLPRDVGAPTRADHEVGGTVGPTARRGDRVRSWP
jgi:hypothetical protein